MRIVDNLIALRIIYLLSTPFEKYDAFRLGLIDAEGRKLKKAETPEESNATSMLHRLVWNLKRIINIAPGGKTRIGSLVAAYLLVKEAYEEEIPPEELQEHVDAELFSQYKNIRLVVEEEYVQELLQAINEDAPTNSTGVATSTDQQAIRVKKRKFASFGVDNDTFNRFKSGKAKYRKWSAYLNLNDDSHKKIHEYARKNPRGILVIKDESGNAKGVRYSRTGGGNWHNISRKSRLHESQEIESFDIYIESLDS